MSAEPKEGPQPDEACDYCGHLIGQHAARRWECYNVGCSCRIYKPNFAKPAAPAEPKLKDVREAWAWVHPSSGHFVEQEGAVYTVPNAAGLGRSRLIKVRVTVEEL